MAVTETTERVAFFSNDAATFGIIMGVLALIFYTATRKEGFWHSFYKHIPALLLCYFVPGLLNTLGLFEKGAADNIYYIASRYLLPASLFLLTLSIDFKKIFGLGWRAVAMFFAGTVGVIIGGPLAVLLFTFIAPEWVGITDQAVPTGEQIWRGLATIAGSWIGGGANQVAMKELYEVSSTLFGTMAVMDVLVAEIWMVALLFMIKKSDSIDKWLKADNSSIEELKVTVEKYTRENERIPLFTDYKMILGVAFFVVGIAHLAGTYWPDMILGSVEKGSKAHKIFTNVGFGSHFFWLIIVSTAFALLLSPTKLRRLDYVGSSKIGTVFIYILVASIGMKMDLTKIFAHYQVFFVGLVWMMIHVIILFTVAKLIKAPYFFIAVGSKANIGGAASAPVVAAAFHPSLAPVGVLLAILGYAVGSLGAIATAIMMKAVVGG
ncbi:DUF819 family protein [Kangiella koreensis]|uniref:Uncharacterized protein n=1 Tax=Kangiella koreensis (strain DSM 16069 / JCM 12317 / KCTC 12182 / SW-125) TaxID=523791 RepID=C7R736_KANKD|nr:DUF819 family protein [Kangiella koreensis]ACV27492.1 protein of unknown function DUF819 [Kangiella koreensis DSM 16069]